jgi:hypothetical protein
LTPKGDKIPSAFPVYRLTDIIHHHPLLVGKHFYLLHIQTLYQFAKLEKKAVSSAISS